MDYQDHVSISEASRKLGIQRPTLSRIIREQKIETEVLKRKKLVSISDCQKAIQKLASEGKLRVRKFPKKTENEKTKYDVLMEMYREMKSERDDLKNRYEALQKRLEAAPSEVKKQNIFHRIGSAWDVLSQT